MIELHVWQVAALIVLLGVLMAGGLYAWGQAIIVAPGVQAPTHRLYPDAQALRHGIA